MSRYGYSSLFSSFLFSFSYNSFQYFVVRILHIGIDIIGPLPETSGKKYIVSLIDYFSKWPKAEFKQIIMQIVLQDLFSRQHVGE